MKLVCGLVTKITGVIFGLGKIVVSRNTWAAALGGQILGVVVADSTLRLFAVNWETLNVYKNNLNNEYSKLLDSFKISELKNLKVKR